MGLNIRGKWTLGGSLPGEPVAPVELGLGAPISGLYLREDVNMKCNIMMTSFVKKTLKKAHSHLVDRLLVKAQIVDASTSNRLLSEKSLAGLGHQPSYAGSRSSGTAYSPASFERGREYGDAKSVDDGQYGGAPQIPPLQSQGWNPGFEFKGPGHDSRDESEESLYPKALSVRSATNSWNGSQNGWQEPQRVSWSNLNGKGGRSTLPKQFVERAYGGNGYAELQPMERLPQSTYKPPPAAYGAAELE
jgi:hypothetical protein